MALNDVTNNVRDGALNGAPDTIENAIVLFGISTAGTANTVYTLNTPQDAPDNLTSGPLCEASAALLEVLEKGPVYVVPVLSDVAGSNGAVTKSGSGPNVTLTGTPLDDYEWVVKMTGGGLLTTAEFKYSVDGGDTWSDAIVTAATYAVPGTGITLNFAAGTYVLGETYSADSVAPGYSTTNLGAAIDAFFDSGEEASLGQVVGVPASAAATAALAAALEAKATVAFANHIFMQWFIEAADVSDATLFAAMDAVDAPHVTYCPGFEEYRSAITSRIFKRSAAWPVAARAALVPVQEHLGRAARGVLPKVTSLYRDERTAATKAKDHRGCALRTRKKGRFFIEEPCTLAAKTSDFSTVHNRRVMDKACRIVTALLEKYLAEDWFLKADGTISEAEAKRIESSVLTDLSNAMAGNASAFVFTISRTDNILNTKKFTVKTRLQPKGYSESIENDIGFTKTVAAAA